jgi:hypothetical protein
MYGKTTRAPAAKVKPVRPVSQTGQTGFGRGENDYVTRNWLDLFAKPVRLVLPDLAKI